MCLDDDEYPVYDIENAIFYHFFSVDAMYKVIDLWHVSDFNRLLKYDSFKKDNRKKNVGLELVCCLLILLF